MTVMFAKLDYFLASRLDSSSSSSSSSSLFSLHAFFSCCYASKDLTIPKERERRETREREKGKERKKVRKCLSTLSDESAFYSIYMKK